MRVSRTVKQCSWCVGVAFAGLAGLIGLASDTLLSATETKIQLGDIYATSGQEEVKDIHYHLSPKVRGDLDAIINKMKWHGPSNVFLVRGKTIVDALHGTRLVLVDGKDAGIVSEQKDDPGETWIVAYFGIGGGVRWHVRFVARTGNVIKVAYELKKAEVSTVEQFFAWVPLGKLPVGDYTLDLIDADRKATTLRRRVTLRALLSK